MAKDGEFKKPYLYGEGKTALETPMQAEIYAEASEMESQWKQPWLHESYPKMEDEFAFPGTPGYPPPPGGYGSGGGDCIPRGSAVGGGAANPCEPGISCGVWEYSCAHKIKSFSVFQNNGWIQSIQYFPNDAVRVTVCWDEGTKANVRQVGPEAVMVNGESAVSKIDLTCVGPGAECTTCQECKSGSKVPAMSYESQQMSVSGAQNLSATGGGGGPYRWTIQSGGGTLSLPFTNSGQVTVYTAPSSNANCDLNPTIRVTDFCGFYTELKIAVNGYTGTEMAVWSNEFNGTYPGTSCTVWRGRAIRCDNTYGSDIGICSYCNGTACGGTGGLCVQDPTCVDPVIQAGCCVASSNCAPVPGKIVNCYEYQKDSRTDAMKAQGCCPAALL